MQFSATVVFNQPVAPGYWRMRLTAPLVFAQANPGQFVMVRLGTTVDPLLRRPFAIFDTGIMEAATPDTEQQAYFEMLYHVVGKGTGLLAELKAGQTLDVLGPLGTGFPTGTVDEEKLLVGGGIGLAPLYLLAKKMLEQGSRVHLFAGGRSRSDVLCFDDFTQLGATCHAATNDGSFGETGFVTAPLERHLDQKQGAATIYACGPTPMLRAVAKLAATRNQPCLVSLEGYMACGVGACLGCVVPGDKHSAQTPDYRCVCLEGPVFEADKLNWE